MEQSEEYYNSVYLNGGSKGEYFKEPEKSIYFPIWQQIIYGLKDDESILDLGCGVGKLANLLIKNNKNYLLGIDFSNIAIEKAKENNPGYENNFIVGDLYNEEIYQLCTYDVVIICEVLEHIENDLFILQNLKKGTKIYFSVPNYNSKGHVRYFETYEKVIMRYLKYIQFEGIPKIFKLNEKNCIYLLKGIIK